MPPDAKSSPRRVTGGQDGGEQSKASITAVITVSRHPISLAEAVHALFALSDERDKWQHRLTAEYRLGYALGHAIGVEEGRRAETAGRDAAWNAIARPIARGAYELSHAEIEELRWGPGGREHFGDPRPGDYPGRGAA